ncbi:unnamed protein product [Notodromas monacha]|uniref:Uncharacterized protein n=1 Tax=Notodromas monacha TaxID=399045 RepID=A0A7R9BRA8_9CRUS|nr:unnamed protein product [Notodromas monacha]CAG0920252.1 unnamed protein product [Notodromas monacha]
MSFISLKVCAHQSFKHPASALLIRLQATVGELKNKLAAERSSEGEEITALKADLVKLRQSLVSLVSHSSSTSGTSSSASMSTEERNFRACCDLAWHKLRDDLRILQEKEQVIFKEFLGNPGGEQLTCWISSPIASAKKQVPTLTSGAELPLPEFQDPCAGEEGGDARISRLLSGVVDKKTRFILESLGARGEFLMDDALNQVLQESSESWADDNDSAQNNLKLSKLDSILQSLGVQDVIKLEHLLSCIEMGMGNRNWDGNLLSHAEIIQGIRRFCKTEESQQISINGRRPVLQSLLYTSRADAFMVPVVQELESHLEDASVLWNCIEEYLTKYMALLRSRSLCCKDMGTASLRNQQLLQILKIYLSSNTGLSVNRIDLGSILDSQGTRDAASLSVQAASLMDHTTKGL